MAIKAPCIINVVNSANYFNFTEILTPIQYKTAVIEDISRPVQHGHDYRFCGFRGTPFTLTVSIRCSNQSIKNQYKKLLSACTGLTYNITDIYNNIHGPFILNGVKYSEERTVYGWNSTQNYCGGSVILKADLELIPQ